MRIANGVNTLSITFPSTRAPTPVKNTKTAPGIDTTVSSDERLPFLNRPPSVGCDRPMLPDSGNPALKALISFPFVIAAPTTARDTESRSR